jgi:hypothetical protein
MVIVGRTKIPFNDLFICTKKEIEAIVRGHEIDIKDAYERERMSAYIISGPYLKKGTTIDKLWPLSWDRPIEVNESKIRESTRKAKEIFAKLKQIKEHGES